MVCITERCYILSLSISNSPSQRSSHLAMWWFPDYVCRLISLVCSACVFTRESSYCFSAS